MNIYKYTGVERLASVMSCGECVGALVGRPRVCGSHLPYSVDYTRRLTASCTQHGSRERVRTSQSWRHGLAVRNAAVSTIFGFV